MEGIYISIKNRLRKKSQEDGITASLLHFAYILSSNSIFQAIVTTALTAAISVMIGFLLFNIWLYVLIAADIVVVSIFAWINLHTQGKLEDLKWYQRTVKSHMEIESIATNDFIKLIKHVLNKAQAKEKPDPRGQWNLQKAAFYVCRSIYNILEKEFGSTEHYVTVYQRFRRETGEDYVKMIAYFSKLGTTEPDNYMKEYKINDGQEYFCKIFNSNDSSVRVLESQKEVSKIFFVRENRRQREEKIQQYIGIPIAINGFEENGKGKNNGIGLLLQIDVDIPKFFGKDKSEVEEKAYNVFFPFATFLHMAYEMGRFIDTSFDKWYTVPRKRNKKEEKEYAASSNRG